MAVTDPALVLNDPLATELMAAPIPARLAYTGLDSCPRVVPVAHHWDGRAFVLATAPQTPKVAALRARPEVALTIDTNVAPQKVLLVRGRAVVQVVDGVPPEYVEGSRKLVPVEQFDGWRAGVAEVYAQMARIEITPTWAKLLDFETRVPDFLEELMRERQAG